MVDVARPLQRSPEERSTSWRLPAAVGAGVAAGTAAIVAVDPRTGGFPVCASQGVLGVDCPLCGGLRCVNALARGDLAAAAGYNVLLAVALPAAALLWVAWLATSVTGRHLRIPTPPRWLVASLLVATAVFSVVRNLDVGPVTVWLSSNG